MGATRGERRIGECARGARNVKTAHSSKKRRRGGDWKEMKEEEKKKTKNGTCIIHYTLPHLILISHFLLSFALTCFY